MKKILSLCAFALAFGALASFAVVDDVTVSGSAVTTNAVTGTYVVRGEVEGIVISVPSAKTCGVSVVTASGFTLFSKTGITSASDGLIPIRVPMYAPGGYAWVNSTSTNIYDKVAVAEAVTITISPDANTTGTNTYSAKLIIKK